MDWFKTHKNIIYPTVFSGLAILLSWSLIVFIYKWSVLNIPLLFSFTSSSSFSGLLESLELWSQEIVIIEKSNSQIISMITVIITALSSFYFRVINKNIAKEAKYIAREAEYTSILSELLTDKVNPLSELQKFRLLKLFPRDT